MYTKPCQKTWIEKHDTLYYALSPVTQSFLLLTDNNQGPNEAVHMVTAIFQHWGVSFYEIIS